MKKSFSIILTLLGSALLTSCGSSEGNENEIGESDGIKEHIDDVKESDDVEGEFKQDVDEGGARLKYHLQRTDKSTEGEDSVNFSIQNIEEEAITLQFGTSMKYDYYILDENDDEIYRESDETSYSEALERLELDPDEEKSFELELPELSAGEYILVLKFAAESFHDAEAHMKFKIEKNCTSDKTERLFYAGIFA